MDTFLSIQHSKELVEWLVQSDKNLTSIYITHAHGDHFLGLKIAQDSFPNAKASATASTVAAMQNQIKPDFIRSFWELRFPGQLPSEFVLPEALKGDTLYLEGEELHVVVSENSISLKTRSHGAESEGRYANVKRRFLAM